MAHLGMYDLLPVEVNPLSFVDRNWHALGLIVSSLTDAENVRVILIGQPRNHVIFLLTACMGSVLVLSIHAFFAELKISCIFLFFLWRISFNFCLPGEVRVELVGAGIGDISPHDLPYHLYLAVIKKRIAWLLSPTSELIFLSFTDVLREFPFS